MPPAVYSADQVTVTIANQLIESGFSDGEFLTIEQDSDAFTKRIGADGEGAYARSNDRSGTAHLKLLQTSKGNKVMQDFFNAGTKKGSSPNAALSNFEVRDRSSGELLVSAETCVISKQTPVSRGKEIGETDWTIISTEMNFNVQGTP